MAGGRAWSPIGRSTGCVGALLALSCGGGSGAGGTPGGEARQSARVDACGTLERACCSAPRFACARGLVASA